MKRIKEERKLTRANNIELFNAPYHKTKFGLGCKVYFYKQVNHVAVFTAKPKKSHSVGVHWKLIALNRLERL